MAQRGGKRPGSGRKPRGLKRILHETPVQLAEAKIAEKLPWLVDKMLELAEGVYEERQIGQDVRIVYKQAPDRQAIAYLIDRVMGKPVQPVDVVQTVLALAAQQGCTDEEAAEAVAEVQRLMKEAQHAGRR